MQCALIVARNLKDLINMNTFLTICLVVLVIFIIAFIFIIIILSKKYLLDSFPNKDASSLRQDAIRKFNNEGFRIKNKGKKLYVEKGTLTATTLYFEQKGNQVDIYRANTATPAAWILIIVGALFFIVLALIIGIISDNNSKDFAEKTILPLLKGSHYGDRICPNCARPIPFDAKICPYCAKKFESYL
jgi:hypothetical protein